MPSDQGADPWIPPFLGQILGTVERMEARRRDIRRIADVMEPARCDKSVTVGAERRRNRRSLPSHTRDVLPTFR